MDESTRKIGIETLSQALTKVQEILTNLPVKNYLQGFQTWLTNRIEEWGKTALRIGLVGITSAGKSTFINALAGEDILPRGAQPTSGILVICRQDPSRRLIVSFRDGNVFDFEEEECTPVWVSRYADETNNPNNEQSVLEVRLLLPKLQIPTQYEVIDSPGLDAFGLEGHEELTLRTLVPLVDLVLFLTTTKSTSDRENLRALAKICKESKPVVVVQTHKDAVEPRYMRGGKILETKEQVLQKHGERVQQLLEQTISLENAHMVQVSSIQALRARLDAPDTPVEKLPAWEQSGFAEVVEVLRKLHTGLSQRMIVHRMNLLLRELQKVLDRVKADYFTARGKIQEAQHYKDAELKYLQSLEDSLPSDQSPDFPDTVKLQKDIDTLKDFFLGAIENEEESYLEHLSMAVRDRIKELENKFFDSIDIVESQLKSVAKEFSIDLEAVKPDEQKKPNLPQLKRYEKLITVESIEQAGFAGRVKRMVGRFVKKEDWGYRERKIKEVRVDREALKEDLLDYHSLYRVKLGTFLKRWTLNWCTSLDKIFAALEQRRRDLREKHADIDPDSYRALLSDIRSVRDWIENQVSDNVKRRQTMGLQAIKKVKEKTREFTQRTLINMNLVLPLLQVSRTLTFTRKTHRFWYVTHKLLAPQNDKPTILISTPFSHEIFDYLGILADLPAVEESEAIKNAIVYSTQELPEDMCAVPVKNFANFSENSRENWFVQKNTILLFHDHLFEHLEGLEAFKKLAESADVFLRVVDIHQIGHEKTRLDNLPIRNILEQRKANLGYIGMGGDRLVKSEQFVDAFKSYAALEHHPGFGMCPMLLGDGEDLLNSLLWLGMTLREDTVADEIKAMEILHRTQEGFIANREDFIRNIFQSVKDFRREQRIQSGKLNP